MRESKFFKIHGVRANGNRYDLYVNPDYIIGFTPFDPKCYKEGAYPNAQSILFVKELDNEVISIDSIEDLCFYL